MCLLRWSNFVSVQDAAGGLSGTCNCQQEKKDQTSLGDLPGKHFSLNVRTEPTGWMILNGEAR